MRAARGAVVGRAVRDATVSAVGRRGRPRGYDLKYRVPVPTSTKELLGVFRLVVAYKAENLKTIILLNCARLQERGSAHVGRVLLGGSASALGAAAGATRTLTRRYREDGSEPGTGLSKLEIVGVRRRVLRASHQMVTLALDVHSVPRGLGLVSRPRVCAQLTCRTRSLCRSSACSPCSPSQSPSAAPRTGCCAPPACPPPARCTRSPHRRSSRVARRSPRGRLPRTGSCWP